MHIYYLYFRVFNGLYSSIKFLEPAFAIHSQALHSNPCDPSKRKILKLLNDTPTGRMAGGTKSSQHHPVVEFCFVISRVFAPEGWV